MASCLLVWTVVFIFHYGYSNDKFVSLDVNNTDEEGATIQINPSYSDAWIYKYFWNGKYNYMWVIDTDDQVDFAMNIGLDDSWGFNADNVSSLEISINGYNIILGDTNTQDDNLCISFSVNSDEFVSSYIRLSGHDDNRIYPKCSTSDAEGIASGSVTELVSSDGNTRAFKMMDGEYGFPMLQPGPDSNSKGISWPITFKLVNDPDKTLNITFSNKGEWSWGSWHPWNQDCVYSAFTAEEGLDIYIGGGLNGEKIYITSVDIKYTSDGTDIVITPNPTENPSPSPSNSPSTSANPTTNPTISPSNNPSKNPSVSPSEDPSLNPSISPSIASSTETPTNSPATANPTATPSIASAITPEPSMTPSTDSQNSSSPTVTPSIAPSINPTVAMTTATDIPTDAPITETTLIVASTTESSSPITTNTTMNGEAVASDSPNPVSTPSADSQSSKTNLYDQYKDNEHVLIILIVVLLCICCCVIFIYFKHSKRKELIKQTEITNDYVALTDMNGNHVDDVVEGSVDIMQANAVVTPFVLENNETAGAGGELLSVLSSDNGYRKDSNSEVYKEDKGVITRGALNGEDFMNDNEDLMEDYDDIAPEEDLIPSEHDTAGDFDQMLQDQCLGNDIVMDDIINEMETEQ